MGWLPGEIAELIRIRLQIEELLEWGRGIDVAGVGVGGGAHANGAGYSTLVAVWVIVEEILTPDGNRVFDELREVAASHGPWNFQTRQRQQGG